MKEYFKVMTFLPNAMPTPFENKEWNTEEQAKQHMNELKKIYDIPLYVSQVFDNRK